MLALTDNAVEAVKALVDSEETGATSGLRMVAEPGGGTQKDLQISFAALPAEDDEVIEERGARIFLEREAASFLDGKILDVRAEDGRLAFMFADQPQD